jgi:hypothetical protein
MNVPEHLKTCPKYQEALVVREKLEAEIVSMQHKLAMKEAGLRFLNQTLADWVTHKSIDVDAVEKGDE